MPDLVGWNSIGTEADDSDPEGLIAQAVEAARAADVAVVVVGTNSRVESEGYNRTTLELPGLQASAPVWAEPGRTTEVTLNVPTRLLAYWDNGWTYEPGEYVLRAGFSVTDLRTA